MCVNCGVVAKWPFLHHFHMSTRGLGSFDMCAPFLSMRFLCSPRMATHDCRTLSKITKCLTSQVLPPTPSKFHYVFTLRDLGRVVEGLCRGGSLTKTPSQVSRLWRHEVFRVFVDKLTNDDDVNVVTGQVSMCAVPNDGFV